MLIGRQVLLHDMNLLGKNILSRLISTLLTDVNFFFFLVLTMKIASNDTVPIMYQRLF